MDKHAIRGPSLSAFEIDSKKIDINLIGTNLEMNPNSVLVLYNYLLEKGIIKS